jgi:MYXO-CTERM domain-containing protein
MIAGLASLPLVAQSTYPDPNRDQRSPAQSDQRNLGEPGTFDMGRTSPMEHRDGFNWGWLGLLGLAGLAGMRHRHNHRHDTNVRDRNVVDDRIDADRV